MAKPETLCPECGYGPVGEESCPSCGALFDVAPASRRFTSARHGQVAFDEDIDQDKTSYDNVLPDAVSARPLGVAAMFFVGAGFFGMEAAGFLGAPRDPALLWILTGMDLVLAVGILFGLGLARAAAYLSVPVHLGLFFLVGRNQVSLPVVLGAMFVLATLLGSVAEPSAVRRVVSLALCIGLLGLRAGAVRTGGPVDDAGVRMQRLQKAGVSLKLPPGFRLLSPGNPEDDLVPLPSGTSAPLAVGFASATGQLVGFVAANTRGGTLEKFSDAVLADMGAVTAPDQMDFGPGELGRLTHASYGMRTFYADQDRSGIITFAEAKDGSLVAIALLVPSSSAKLLQPNAQRVFGALSLPK